MALWLGLLLSVTSSLIGFAALNIQKLAQREDRPRPGLNLAGVGLAMVVGPLDMVAYSCAPQSLLAPVGTMSLVFNLVAAPALHGDTVGARDVSATALVVAGTAMCLLYGARGGDGESGSESAAVLEGERDPVPIVPDAGGPDAGAFLCYVALVGAAAAALVSVLVAKRKVGGHSDAAANAALAGLLGSTTVVASKGIGAVASEAEFSAVAVVRSALPLAALIPCHLYTLNRGMGRHSSLVMVPGNAASGLLCNIGSGLLLYGEAPTSAPRFGLGVLLLLGGMLALTLCAPGAPAAAKLPPDALRRSTSGAEKGTLSPRCDEEAVPARRRTRIESLAAPTSRLITA